MLGRSAGSERESVAGGWLGREGVVGSTNVIQQYHALASATCLDEGLACYAELLEHRGGESPWGGVGEIVVRRNRARIGLRAQDHEHFDSIVFILCTRMWVSPDGKGAETAQGDLGWQFLSEVLIDVGDAADHRPTYKHVHRPLQDVPAHPG